jgi:hypothetical protein
MTMAQTKEQRLAAIHTQALEEFDRIQSALREERLQCLQDRRFYSIAGAQWEGPLGDQFENKPRLEFNKVHLAVIRIINEYRNNRITVDFIPKDGTTNADLADTCAGLYRADERDSGAQEAYDNCFEEGVGGGFGALRLRADYEDDEDDDNDQQRVRIEPIFDADSSVFFDLDAKRQDKADATRCYVLKSMTHEAFEEEYGHKPTTWPKAIHQREFDWWTPDVVYVCEHYRVEETTDLIHVFRGLDDVDMKVPDSELQADPTKLSTLLATGFREVRQKRVKRRVVNKYILSGLKVEDDQGAIAGRCIPIIPFYGKRWFVDNVERCQGHVRLAKDAQRLTNSLLSWLTEIAGRFDMEKPIVSPEQMKGHATMWAEDNVKRFPYLLLNLLKDSDGNVIPGVPLDYTKAPNVPPAMAALIQIAYQALDDLLGNQQAGEQMQPNLSGKAVELIQTRLDMQVFIYMSNFAKTMQRVGEVWLSMSKDILIEDGRQMKTLSTDGEPDTVTLREPQVDPDTGEQVLANNMDDAKFDVWPDVGPSSSSKRAATVRALTGIASITQDPDMLQVLTAASIMNMEGEGLQELRDYCRSKLVRMGVVQPTDEEKQELQAEQANTPPDPQTQYLQASASQAAADAETAHAKTISTLADADLKRAQTALTYAEAMGEVNAQHVAVAQTIHGILTTPAPAAPGAPAAPPVAQTPPTIQ